jgi:hypothetical protein
MYFLSEWCVKISERQAGRERPSPQLPEYMDDVLCEHGSLQPDVNTRRVLNGEVYFTLSRLLLTHLFQAIAVLYDYFPDWRPPPEDTKVCEICSDKEEAALAESKLQITKEKVG